MTFFFFSSRRRHTISKRDWSSDVCSSDLKNLPRPDCSNDSNKAARSSTRYSPTCSRNCAPCCKWNNPAATVDAMTEGTSDHTSAKCSPGRTQYSTRQVSCDKRLEERRVDKFRLLQRVF